jgi:hypothetical protein
LQGYVLSPGDIIKLGRIEYAVIEFRDEKGEIHSIRDLFCTVIAGTQSTMFRIAS